MLDNFSSLEVNGNIEVEFYPHSGAFKAELSGGENLLEGCRTEVQDGVLKLRNDNKCNWLRDYKKRVVLKIYGDSINELVFYGGGNLIFKDTLRINVFTFLGWESSGDVTILLDAKDTYIKLNTGTTDVYLYGKSPELYYYSLTQGFIYGKEFECDNAFVAQFGYGDFYINPSTQIGGEITKTGNVYYPGKIKSSVVETGKGRLLEF